MKILGIETSCDETAAAVVEDGKRLLSNVVFSSMDLHAVYGGVVPEIAARSHIESIIPVIEKAVADAFLENAEREDRSEVIEDPKPLRTSHSSLHTPKFDPWDQIDGIAVTYGAGLGGSLLVGVMTARTLAIAKNKPLYAINHVEAHIYANFLTEVAPPLLESKEQGARSKDEAPTAHSSLLTAQKYLLRKTQPVFPMLGLIVSGGHSQLVIWRDHFDYTLLGQTHDDAIGEAFDKVAKILGLPYPGGPNIGAFAKHGDSFAYNFPKAKMPGKYDFSFSGIKTAVLRTAQAEIGEDHTFPSHKLSEHLSEAQKANIAASFQRTAIETVVDKTILAYEEFTPKSIVIGGGVASSPELRHQLSTRLSFAIGCDPIALVTDGILLFQDYKLMTDNGAMVATLGCYQAMMQQSIADPYTLEIAPNLSM